MAAAVAPPSVSGGVDRLRGCRFQRAMITMTPRKDAALMANAVPTPDAAITIPASAGPKARAKLNSMPLSADADARSSLGTSSGKTARQVGLSKASPAERANVRTSSSDGVMMSADGGSGQDNGDADHPHFGEQDQLPAIHNVADGSCRQSENKEWQGAGGLRQGNIKRSSVQRDHEPGCAPHSA